LTLKKAIGLLFYVKDSFIFIWFELDILDSPGIRLPWQNDSIEDVFENLSNQERNDITHEAQVE